MDLHEEDTEYLKRVRNAYVELADSDINWCTIECAENNQIKPKESISDEIWQAISKILS